MNNFIADKLELWPEVGSRTFRRVFDKPFDRLSLSGDWIVVQPDRYRYVVAETGGIIVRMVLSEYLVCEVAWDD